MPRVEFCVWLVLMVTVLVTAPIGSTTDPDFKQLQTENRNMRKILETIQKEFNELKLDNGNIQREFDEFKFDNGKILEEFDQLKEHHGIVMKRLEQIEFQQRTKETIEVTPDEIQEVDVDDEGIAIQNNYVPSNVYTRWGRTTCGLGLDRVYSGLMGKARGVHTGGGINQQCLPHNPQYANYVDGYQYDSPGRGLMYGAEYQGDPDSVFDQTNLEGSTFVNNDIPCAVCRVENQTSVLMIPAQKECPNGWNELYWGYLMSELYNGAGVSEFICVDHAPEVVNGGSAATPASHMHLVEIICGYALPCPDYIDGWELTCVVCTR